MYLKKRPEFVYIGDVAITRKGKNLTVNLFVSRSTLVIGKKSCNLKEISAELSKMTNKKVFINVNEIRKPLLSASLVAKSIAKQIEKRASYKRAIKNEMESVLRAGAKGIRVICSGRLNGADIARSERFEYGNMPLHTMISDVNYYLAEAHTTYGVIGLKVWIHKV